MTTNLQHPESPPADFLPFAADSAIRRLHHEGVLLLGGGRAVLLQLAHPSVAQGVAEHSGYARQRWRRLMRTLRPMYAIAFGSADQALAAAAGVNHQHERVRGAGYDALDPALLVWVLSTLIETSLYMHERFLRPLTPDEAEAYYDDMHRVGELLRIPHGRLPGDLAAFRDYYESQLAGLRVSEDARAIAADLLRYTPLNFPFVAPLRFLTAGTLPPVIREQYDFAWAGRDETCLRALQAVSRGVLRRLPLALRGTPGFLLPPRR